MHHRENGSPRRPSFHRPGRRSRLPEEASPDNHSTGGRAAHRPADRTSQLVEPPGQRFRSTTLHRGCMRALHFHGAALPPTTLEREPSFVRRRCKSFRPKGLNEENHQLGSFRHFPRGGPSGRPTSIFGFVRRFCGPQAGRRLRSYGEFGFVRRPSTIRRMAAILAGMGSFDDIDLSAIPAGMGSFAIVFPQAWAIPVGQSVRDHIWHGEHDGCPPF